MNREEMLKNRGYHLAKIQSQLFRELNDYLEQNNLSRTQFAKKFKFSKKCVSQILEGDFNKKLSKLVELSLAIGKVPEIKFMAFNELKEIPKT